jgi:L-seryl-tRNA(Ser) seleniumtransferase
MPFLCYKLSVPMNELLRKIPKVDDILRHENWTHFTDLYPDSIARDGLNMVLDGLRDGIKSGAITTVPTIKGIIDDAHLTARRIFSPKLKRVINGTGVIIHTNLGRSLLAKSAIEAMMSAGSYYTNLEYDLEKGERGDRYSHCSHLITKLTGAENALVVNNNAAAVYLVLNTFAQGKEAIVSRGELVEIGGSFRIPDVMRQSGVTLREVGTTNRTYVDDYRQAITDATALFVKVHTSNFRVRGFVHAPMAEELVALSKALGIPTFLDAGSGLLFPLPEIDAHDEPIIRDEVARGYDIVSFSGDKLLGGPQAGIIVGRTPLIDAMKKNPLTRALRPDKFTLSGLENTLLLCFDPELAKQTIPTLRMIHASAASLKGDAEHLMETLATRCEGGGISVKGLEVLSEVGGGTLPDVTIPSFGIALKPLNLTIDEFDRRLRHLEVPIVGRIEKDALILDMRTILMEDKPFIVAGIQNALRHE